MQPTNPKPSDLSEGVTNQSETSEFRGRAALGDGRTDARAGAHRTDGGRRGDVWGGAAAPRLEKRTYFNTTHTGKNRLILRNYGSGLAEVGWSFISAT